MQLHEICSIPQCLKATTKNRHSHDQANVTLPSHCLLYCRTPHTKPHCTMRYSKLHTYKSVAFDFSVTLNSFQTFLGEFSCLQSASANNINVREWSKCTAASYHHQLYLPSSYHHHINFALSSVHSHVRLTLLVIRDGSCKATFYAKRRPFGQIWPAFAF